MRFISLLCFIIVSFCCQAETHEEKVEDFKLCYNVAKTFLKKHSTVESDNKWLKVWDAQLTQKIKDNPDWDENKFANGKVLNFVASKMSIKSLNDLSIEDRITICRFFCLYIDRELSFPQIIKDNVNSDRMVRLAYDLLNN